MNPLFLFGTQSTPLRKLLLMKIASGGGALVEYTVTGNPVTFETDVAKPLSSVLATWQPHQSGSGDPSPSNVRPVVGMDGVTVWHTGKNVFPDTNLNRGYINSSGEFNSQLANALSDYIPYVYGQKVTIYLEDSVNDGVYSVGIAYYDKDKQFLGRNSQGGHEIPYTFPLYSGTGFGYIRIWINRDNEYYTVDEFKAFGLYAQFGDDFTAYEPYHGTSYSVAFPVLGKNLLDPSLFQNLANKSFVNYTNGELVYFSTYYNASDYVLIKGNTEYTLHAGMKGQSTAGCAFYDENKQYISGFQTNTATATYYTFTSPSNAVYMRFSDSSEIVPFDSVWFEYGDTPSPYEPYTRTCYGGTLDLTTGVLTAEWAYILLDGSQTPTGVSNIMTDTIMVSFPYSLTKNTLAWKEVKAVCDKRKFALYTNSAFYNVDDLLISFNGGAVTGIQLKCPKTEVTDVESAVAYLQDNPLQVAYTLETPITFQLTPQQITALIGNNTMWADADSLSVTYLKKG